MIIYVKVPADVGVAHIQVTPSTCIGDIISTLWDNSDTSIWLGSKLLEKSKHVSDYDGIVYGSMLRMTVPLSGGANIGKLTKGAATRKTGDKGEGAAVFDDKLEASRLNDEMKKQMALQKSALKSKLDLEAKHTKTNKHRILNQWRKIQRQNKVEYLHKDIEILSQNHERDVDRKDAWVVLLDRDLEEAEEQFQIALRSHLQNVDALVSIQDSRLLGLEKEFDSELGILETEFTAEADHIKKQHAKDRKALLDIMGAVEATEYEREAEAKQEHEQLREEIKNKNDEDINVLRMTLETTIDELENHFESAHLNYLQNTDQRTQDFKRLTGKDEHLSEDIERKIRKIDRLQKKIKHWRTKISQNKRECEERNKSLAAEKDVISAHFRELKAKMNGFRHAQSSRLSALTRNARSCKTSLTEKIELAERILELAELARKMETEREKVLPFYSSMLHEESGAGEAKNEEEDAIGVKGSHAGEKEHRHEIDMSLGSGTDGHTIHPYQPVGLKAPLSAKAAAAAGGEVHKGLVVPECNYLDNFYKRYNKVLLDKLSLEKEKERLAIENRDLQDILKQYLDGISVNEDVLKGSNPLLVVNGKVSLNSAPVRRAGAPTIVEANHMVLTRRIS